MDCSIITLIVNFTGEKHLLDPNVINDYLSFERSRGRAPTTLYLKTQSFKRFLNFLEIKKSNLLPKSKDLKILLSMPNGVEKTLLRERFLCQKDTMQKNRNKFSSTIDALQEWRRKRHTAKELQLFTQFENSCNDVVLSNRLMSQ